MYMFIESLKIIFTPLALFFVLMIILFASHICSTVMNRGEKTNRPYCVWNLRLKSHFLLVLVLYVCSLPITGNIIISEIRDQSLSVNQKSSLDNIEHLIVLGGASSFDSLLGRNSLLSSGDRLLLAVQLASNTNIKSLILSGGNAEAAVDGLSEAARDSAILMDMKVSGKLLLLENSSRNTIENANNVVRRFPEVIAEEGIVGLITSASHMRRAAWTFCHYGVNVVELPTDVPAFRSPMYRIGWIIPSVGNLQVVTEYLTEWLGLQYYRRIVFAGSRECQPV